MRALPGIAIGLTLVAASVGARSNAPAPTECSAPRTASAETTTDFRLVLNVPAYRLDVVEHGIVTRTIKVAVGLPRYRTPLGRFRIDYAVWNPWWRPPDSEWARKERPVPPGWANPVGRVKLHVTGLVFLHGSPFKNSFGTAASHACVRMSNQDAIALARLVHEHAGPAIEDAMLDSLAADTARTRSLALTRAVPIDIDYTLAEVRGTELVLYRDIYRYAGNKVPPVEEQAVQAIRAERGDSVTIDLGRLRLLVRRARYATVRLLLDSLLSDVRYQPTAH